MIETKLNGQTLDIVAENVKKLRELFPEIIVEDKIDFDRLQDVLGNYIERNDESYRFNWYGKSDAFRKSQTPSTGTLRPCVEESKNWDTTENIYIEGDNLEVLKILEKSYSGKIKMIYIDPPYNKDKDFIYPDKWSDPIKEYKKITGQISEEGLMTDTEEETEGGRHTKWLNMMYPRLRKARNLLAEDGVIFISIDDDEVANLKRLCNDVFGEENFIAQIPRVTKKGGKSTEYIALNHDYCLIYSKSECLHMYPLEHDDSGFKNQDIYIDERGLYKLNQTLDYDTLGYINSLDYPIVIDGITYYAGNVSKEEFEERKKSNPKDGYRWRWSKELFEFGLNNGFVEVKKGKNGSRIYTKTYQNATINENETGYFVEIIPRTKAMSSLEVTENKYSNDNAKKAIDAIMGKGIFDYTKPVSLLELLARLGAKNNDIVLDFFSGSATTAHAIMQINSEDKHNRRFIMVQVPETTAEDSEAFKAGYDTICEIGKERIRRAGDKIKTELQEKYDEYKQKQQSLLDDEVEPMNPEDLDIGFKVFKLDSSNLQRWNLDVGENFYELSDEDQNAFISEKLGLFVNNFTEGRTELDMVYEIMLKYGLPLTMPIEIEKVFSKTLNEDVTLYNIGMGGLIVCLSDRLSEDVADGIVKLVEETEPATVRVVVKDFNFITDAGKTNFKETLRTGVESYFAKTDNKANNENQFEFITI